MVKATGLRSVTLMSAWVRVPLHALRRIIGIQEISKRNFIVSLIPNWRDLREIVYENEEKRFSFP